MTPRERAQKVAAEARTGSFTRGNLRVTIDSVVYTETGTATVMCRAWRGGVEVPLDLPVHVVNPPVMVPDTAGPHERRDANGNVLGRYREDANAALRQVLVDLVEGRLR